MSVTITLTYGGEVVKIYHGNQMPSKVLSDWSKLYPKHLFEKCIIDIKDDSPPKFKKIKIEEPSIIPPKFKKNKINGAIQCGSRKGGKVFAKIVRN